MAFVIRGITKGISNGIGLAGEKYYDHKERKAALAEQDKSQVDVKVSELDGSNPSSPSSDNIANDERIWALDEAAGDPPGYEEASATPPDPEAGILRRPTVDRTVSELVHDTVTSIYPEDHSELEYDDQKQAPHLSYPIVIPQRRPGTKARGFARAYPPDLEAFNMDQDYFLRFLQNFHEASQASPWLNTLFVAAGAVGLLPGHITMAVSISVQFAAGTAIELQSRYKANAFLDQMNREVFMPKGLYCMILMCKDGAEGSADAPTFGYETVNLENAKSIAKWGLPKNNPDDEIADITKKNKVLRSIRLTSGRTKSNEMPLEIAPLVYPGLEDMIERPAVQRDENFKGRMMRHKEFVADYFDRRAQAEYAGNNPGSALTSGGTPEFRTRFADPNHPCNNGHLFSLVTGGWHVAQPRGRRGREGRSRLREVGEDGKLKPKAKMPERPIRGPVSLVAKGVRKVMTPNILYLTIVNMPSEEELAEARRVMQGEADESSFKKFFEGTRLDRETMEAYKRR